MARLIRQRLLQSCRREASLLHIFFASSPCYSQAVLKFPQLPSTSCGPCLLLPARSSHSRAHPRAQLCRPTCVQRGVKLSCGKKQRRSPTWTTSYACRTVLRETVNNSIKKVSKPLCIELMRVHQTRNLAWNQLFRNGLCLTSTTVARATAFPRRLPITRKLHITWMFCFVGICMHKRFNFFFGKKRLASPRWPRCCVIRTQHRIAPCRGRLCSQKQTNKHTHKQSLCGRHRPWKTFAISTAICVAALIAFQL